MTDFERLSIANQRTLFRALLRLIPTTEREDIALHNEMKDARARCEEFLRLEWQQFK